MRRARVNLDHVDKQSKMPRSTMKTKKIFSGRATNETIDSKFEINEDCRLEPDLCTLFLRNQSQIPTDLKMSSSCKQVASILEDFVQTLFEWCQFERVLYSEGFNPLIGFETHLQPTITKTRLLIIAEETLAWAEEVH